MAPRRFAVVLSLFCATILSSLAAATSSAAPALTGAVSRMSHNGAIFDVTLPITGPSGIECRDPGNAATFPMQVVLTFSEAVTGGGWSVAGGAAKNGAATFSGSTMTVNMAGAASGQSLTITATSVVGASGTLPTTSVGVRLLKGDINGDGFVTSGDVNLCKVATGVALSQFNFRRDVNVDGSISSGDVNIVKASTGGSITGGGTGDTAPTIGTIADQEGVRDQATTPVGFSVNDAEVDPGTLAVIASSDNAALLPDATAYAFGGSGNSRTLTITPAAGQTGTANVTVSVTDGQTITPTTFVLTVTPPPTLFIATMTPNQQVDDGGHPNIFDSLGTGQATLLLSGDETHATLRFSYSNLTTPESSEHIHGPGGSGVNAGIIYDIDQNTPDSEGNYTWVFQVSGGVSVADQINAIKTGNTYINVHTFRHTGGEIRGQFLLASGSQTFTAPPAPPALPPPPPTLNDAARFLSQATFGPTDADIATVQSTGFDTWLNNQIATPQTSMRDHFLLRTQTYYDTNNPPNTQAYSPDLVRLKKNSLDDDRIVEEFWRLAISSPDQLRQRVAFAYSQIFVVSSADTSIASFAHLPGLAKYWDILAADAFGNFRTLLQDVTLSPVMGDYLNMMGNSIPSPNENYAREIMQLFSVGLRNLHPDGTLRLGTDGLPIQTYDQFVIQDLAQVFTGWDQNGTVGTPPTGYQKLNYYYDFNNGGVAYTPAAPLVRNDQYSIPMIVKSPSTRHSKAQKSLLQYFPRNDDNSYGNTKYPYLIAARTGTETTATTTADLNFALDNIFHHPNVGPFVCRELIQRLIGSDPSPAFVYRVTKKFENDGTGVRGNMQAVVKAILTDYEARSTDFLGNDPQGRAKAQGYGRLREPILRTAGIIRAFHPVSQQQTQDPTLNAVFVLSPPASASDYGQIPVRSPTVFNFYEPNYISPGDLADAGLFSPEFQITNETTAVNLTNWLYKGIYSDTTVVGTEGWHNRGRGVPASQLPDVVQDYTTELNLLKGTTVTDPLTGLSGLDAVLARANVLLAGGQLDSTTISTIKTQVTGLPNANSADKINRIKSAIYLIASSAQGAVQK